LHTQPIDGRQSVEYELFMIILDFDGVLFNDERFKRDYWRLFRRAGIPHRIHQDAYIASKELHRGGYRHDLHLTLVKRHMPAVQIPALEQNIWKLLGHSAEYLYHDTKPFLRYWQSKGEALALVSSGNAFQEKKVHSSGITSLFLAAIVADTSDKVYPVRALVKRAGRNRIVFIDDRRNFVDAVKQNFPRILVLQMIRRRDRERSVAADAIVPNLAAARRFIESRAVRQAPNEPAC